ncbi:MAG TPA: VOC family protein [Candidatus Angelobacter sp.]
MKLMPKLNKLTPMLTVTNMDETIRFYHDLLGFECCNRNEGWARLLNYGAEIMIALPNARMAFEHPQFTGSFYMILDDVDALWQEVRDKVTVVFPIENFYYGMREFAIRDNNGYMLQFGSEITDPSQIPPRDED